MNQRIEQLEPNLEEGIQQDSQPSVISKPRALIARTALLVVLQAQAACSGAEFSIGAPEDAGTNEDGGGGEGGTSTDGGTDAGVDAQLDAAPEADAGDADADAGPVYGFANDPKKNVCIKWMTMNGGVKQNASPDDNNCDPKPYGVLPLAPSLDLGVWSKDAPTNNAVGFTSPYNITTYNTRCSPSPTPPNNAQMESLMLGGGYVGTTNSSILPNVDLVNASCANGAMYVMHIAP